MSDILVLWPQHSPLPFECLVRALRSYQIRHAYQEGYIDEQKRDRLLQEQQLIVQVIDLSAIEQKRVEYSHALTWGTTAQGEVVGNER